MRAVSTLASLNKRIKIKAPLRKKSIFEFANNVHLGQLQVERLRLVEAEGERER